MSLTINKQKYFDSIEASIKEVLADPLFINYKQQMFAIRLKAELKKSYDENYLWNKSLFLSNNASNLLNELYFTDKSLIIKAIKESAEVYEYLSEISELYDREYCRILSALCYDISGYQANAMCILRGMETYELAKSNFNYDISEDNYILFHIQQILLKKIPFAYSKTIEIESKSLGLKTFHNAINNFYKKILFGKDSNYIEELNKYYSMLLNQGNIYISHLIFLLITRINEYEKKSIWNNLKKEAHNKLWNKYIKILGNNLYEENKIKKNENRISKFEFWISQLEAIKKGILEKEESFVVQMPTSAGKTFIAELVILDSLVKFPKKKCIYIAPYRALTNEIENELSKNISTLGYSISKLSGSYEVDEFQSFILDETDVLVATPEKIDFLLRFTPSFFKNVSLVVLDEGHFIGKDDDRSSLIELLIINLKRRIKELKILFISAVIISENAVEISNWISNNVDNVISSPKYVDEKVWEPTRKLIGKFSWQETSKGLFGRIDYPFIKIETKNKNEVFNAFAYGVIKQEKIGRNKFPKKNNKPETAVALACNLSLTGNTLIFCARADWAKSISDAFTIYLNILESNNISLPYNFKKNIITESYYHSLEWYGENSNITKCISHGIGIHFGDMPEPLRRSIENDYRQEKLKILISTNTIGHGLNFPIKNLIIYSLKINPSKNITTTVRDFWNIIGRAGRAGKETEGQIIFIDMNDGDNKEFLTYTNINNLERVESRFYKLLIKLFNNRISNDEFIIDLRYLTEPFILNTLIEEVIGTNEEKIIEEIINNSLFKVQAVNFDLEPIRNAFKVIFKDVYNELPTNKDIVKEFSKTGFNLKSNTVIYNYINDNIQELKNYVESSEHLKILEHIINVFYENNIKEILLTKINVFESISKENLLNFIIRWIEGDSINDLRNIWVSISPQKLHNKLGNFMSEALSYRYSWGITSFLILLSKIIVIDFDSLPINIKNLSTYIKYGLNDELGCFALSLGVKDRNLALKISKLYDNESKILKDTVSFKKFVLW